MGRKILYVATVVKTHIMEFHIPYLKLLKEMGYETAVAAANDYDNPEECKIPYCDHYYEIDFDRNPIHQKNIKAVRQLKTLIEREKFDIVHCHTPVGAMAARIAARDIRKKGTKVVYTAHGFHFFKGASWRNWLLYYPVERFLARYTDVLITINREDFERASGFPAGRVEYIPGIGIDTHRFKPCSQSEKEMIKERLNIPQDAFVIMTVGELIKRKNHEILLRAMAKGSSIGHGKERCENRISKASMLNREKRCIIVGRGKLEKKLKKLAEELGIAKEVQFLGYRNDIPELLHAADLFVFMSYQEGLPVALMEAIACGLPCIVSKIRGNTDLVTDNVNGIFCDFDEEKLAAEIRWLEDDPDKAKCLSDAARDSINAFSLEHVLEKMQKLYADL